LADEGVKLSVDGEDGMLTVEHLYFAAVIQRIMPAVSRNSSYFRLVLSKMDAIGSGDYQFTSELLHYAAQLRAMSLRNAISTRSQTFANSTNYETDKFPWLDFARGLSRTSGCRTLAK